MLFRSRPLGASQRCVVRREQLVHVTTVANPFGTEFDGHWQIGLAVREYASADTIARLEHEHAATRRTKAFRGGQPGETCANHDDVDVVRHGVPACVEGAASGVTPSESILTVPAVPWTG